ncbi:hypothetical protein HDV63DRAFT_376454 [Trichoderma sp. SZMC 28014]
MLSPQDDPKSPLYYNIYDIEQIIYQLRVKFVEIREIGTRFHYHKVAKLKSNLDKSINSLKEYTIKAAVAGLEIWNPKEKSPKPSKKANKQLPDRIINLHARIRSQVSLATEKTRNAKACQMEDEERSAVRVSFVLGPDAGDEAVQLKRQPQRPLTKRDFPKKCLNNHNFLQEGHLDEESTISSGAAIEHLSFTATGTTTTKATGTVHENICLLSQKWPGMPEVQHISYKCYSDPLSWIHLLQWAWM